MFAKLLEHLVFCKNTIAKNNNYISIKQYGVFPPVCSPSQRKPSGALEPESLLWVPPSDVACGIQWQAAPSFPFYLERWALSWTLVQAPAISPQFVNRTPYRCSCCMGEWVLSLINKHCRVQFFSTCEDRAVRCRGDRWANSGLPIFFKIHAANSSFSRSRLRRAVSCWSSIRTTLLRLVEPSSAIWWSCFHVGSSKDMHVCKYFFSLMSVFILLIVENWCGTEI